MQKAYQGSEMARGTTITPVLRYRDVGVASRWLCEALGFQEHNRAQELGGHVRYLSLRLGDSFVLVRPIGNSVFDNLMVQPEAVGGANTQICYLTIADATEHCARAKAAGAIIELEPRDDGLGGSFYTCRDLEGHLWSFGTQTYGVAHGAASAFEPAELSSSLPRAGIASPHGHSAREPARRSWHLREIGIAVATAVLVSAGWLYLATYVDSTSSAPGALADIRQEKDQAVRALKSSNELLQEHRLARERAEAEVAASKAQIVEMAAKLAKTAETEARLAKLQQDALIDKKELQEARAALLAAKRQNEELLARFEPAPSDARQLR
jgi:uncharacterized glyoxalase superfamily protein PhnB